MCVTVALIINLQVICLKTHFLSQFSSFFSLFSLSLPIFVLLTRLTLACGPLADICFYVCTLVDSALSV